MIAAFLLQDLAFANPDLKPVLWSGVEDHKPWARKFLPEIPDSVAVLEDAWRSPEAGKTLILIQDAHTNPSGQINLSKALDLILQKTPAQKIFLEAGTGDESLSFLRPHAPLEKREQIAMSYLRKGELQGSEYLSLISDRDFTLWGVEDPELYARALEAYRAVAKNRERFELYLNRVEKTVKVLKPRVYNPELLEFDEQFGKRQKDRVPLTDHLELLIGEARRLEVDLPSSGNLKTFRKLRALEQRIDFEKAGEEQARALRSLSPEVRKDLFEAQNPSRAAHDNKVQRAYFTRLEEKLSSPNAFVGDQPDSRQKHAGMTVHYPELSKYFRYLKASQEIDLRKLLEEQKALEKGIFKALATSEEERILIECSRNLGALKKLLYLQFTPDDWKEYREDRKAFELTRMTGFLNRKIMDFGQFYEDVTFLEPGYEEIAAQCEKFYELTYARDRAFISNLLSRMGSRDPVAILITGGYHTPNLKALLRRENISYLVLTPQILHETHQMRYEKLLLSQNVKTPPVHTGPPAHALMIKQTADKDNVLGNQGPLAMAIAGKGWEELKQAGARLAEQEVAMKMHARLTEMDEKFEKILSGLRGKEFSWQGGLKGDETIDVRVELSSDVRDRLIISPTTETLRKHPYLRSLETMPVEHKGVAPKRSFGQIVVAPILVNDKFAIYIEQVQASRGFKHIGRGTPWQKIMSAARSVLEKWPIFGKGVLKRIPSRSQLEKAYAWAGPTVHRLAELIGELDPEGKAEVYASTDEAIRFLAKRSSLWDVHKGTLAVNYRKPFQNDRWKPVNVDIFHPLWDKWTTGDEELHAFQKGIKLWQYTGARLAARRNYSVSGQEGELNEGLWGRVSKADREAILNLLTQHPKGDKNERSYHYRLMKPFRQAGDRYSAVQIKGFYANKAASASPHEGLGRSPMNLFGPHAPSPENGMTAVHARAEFDNTLKLFKAAPDRSRLRVKLPLGWGTFPDIRFRDEPLGFVLLAVPDFMNKRWNETHHSTARMLRGAHAAGRALRWMHEQGLGHGFFHPGNMSWDPKGGLEGLFGAMPAFGIHDLDNAFVIREKAGPEPRAVASVMIADMLYALFKLHLLPLRVRDARKAIEVSQGILKAFVEGYFSAYADLNKRNEAVRRFRDLYFGLIEYLDEGSAGLIPSQSVTDRISILELYDGYVSERGEDPLLMDLISGAAARPAGARLAGANDENFTALIEKALGYKFRDRQRLTHLLSPQEHSRSNRTARLAGDYFFKFLILDHLRKYRPGTKHDDFHRFINEAQSKARKERILRWHGPGNHAYGRYRALTSGRPYTVENFVTSLLGFIITDAGDLDEKVAVGHRFLARYFDETARELKIGPHEDEKPRPLVPDYASYVHDIQRAARMIGPHLPQGVDAETELRDRLRKKRSGPKHFALDLGYFDEWGDAVLDLVTITQLLRQRGWGQHHEYYKNLQVLATKDRMLGRMMAASRGADPGRPLSNGKQDYEAAFFEALVGVLFDIHARQSGRGLEAAAKFVLARHREYFKETLDAAARAELAGAGSAREGRPDRALAHYDRALKLYHSVLLTEDFSGLSLRKAAVLRAMAEIETSRRDGNGRAGKKYVETLKDKNPGIPSSLIDSQAALSRSTYPFRFPELYMRILEHVRAELNSASERQPVRYAHMGVGLTEEFKVPQVVETLALLSRFSERPVEATMIDGHQMALLMAREPTSYKMTYHEGTELRPIVGSSLSAGTIRRIKELGIYGELTDAMTAVLKDGSGNAITEAAFWTAPDAGRGLIDRYFDVDLDQIGKKIGIDTFHGLFEELDYGGEAGQLDMVVATYSLSHALLFLRRFEDRLEVLRRAVGATKGGGKGKLWVEKGLISELTGIPNDPPGASIEVQIEAVRRELSQKGLAVDIRIYGEIAEITNHTRSVLPAAVSGPTGSRLSAKSVADIARIPVHRRGGLVFDLDGTLRAHGTTLNPDWHERRIHERLAAVLLKGIPVAVMTFSHPRDAIQSVGEPLAQKLATAPDAFSRFVIYANDGKGGAVRVVADGNGRWREEPLPFRADEKDGALLWHLKHGKIARSRAVYVSDDYSFIDKPVLRIKGLARVNVNFDARVYYPGTVRGGEGPAGALEILDGFVTGKEELGRRARFEKYLAGLDSVTVNVSGEDPVAVAEHITDHPKWFILRLRPSGMEDPRLYKSTGVWLHLFANFVADQFRQSGALRHGSDLDFVLSEVLKNAFRHGSKLNFALPIAMKLFRDREGRLNRIEVLDAASMVELDPRTKEIARSSNLGGENHFLRAVGENHHYWDYRREEILEKGEVTGSRVILKMKPQVSRGARLAAEETKKYNQAVSAVLHLLKEMREGAPDARARALSDLLRWQARKERGNDEPLNGRIKAPVEIIIGHIDQGQFYPARKEAILEFFTSTPGVIFRRIHRLLGEISAKGDGKAGRKAGQLLGDMERSAPAAFGEAFDGLTADELGFIDVKPDEIILYRKERTNDPNARHGYERRVYRHTVAMRNAEGQRRERVFYTKRYDLLRRGPLAGLSAWLNRPYRDWRFKREVRRLSLAHRHQLAPQAQVVTLQGDRTLLLKPAVGRAFSLSALEYLKNEDRSKFGYALGRALGRLHSEAKMVHGDLTKRGELKSDNIFWVEDPRTKELTVQFIDFHALKPRHFFFGGFQSEKKAVRGALETDAVREAFDRGYAEAAGARLAAARRGASVEKIGVLYEVYSRGRRPSYVSALLTLAHSISSPKSVEDQFGSVGARMAISDRFSRDLHFAVLALETALLVEPAEDRKIRIMRARNHLRRFVEDKGEYGNFTRAADELPNLTGISAKKNPTASDEHLQAAHEIIRLSRIGQKVDPGVLAGVLLRSLREKYMTAGKGACPGSENIIGHLAAAIETYTHQNTRDEKAQKEFYEQLTTIREEDIRPLYIDLSVKGPRDENALFAAADLINHLNNLQHQVLAGQIALMDKYDSGVVDRIGRGDLRSDGLAKDLLEEWRARYGSKAVPAEVMLLLARAAENATRPHSRQRQDAGAAADTLAAIFGSLFVHEQNNFLGYLYYQSIREDRGAYAFAAHYLEPRSGTDGMNFVIYPPIESVGAPGTDTAEGARLAGRKGSSYPGDKAFEALLWRFQAHLTNIGRQLKITHQEVLYLIKKHRFKTLARRIRRQREDDYPGDSKFAAVLRRHKAHQKAVAAQLGVTDSKVSAWIVTHRFKTLATLLRKERNSRYPGHAKFRALLHKHGGNLSRIAEALNVKQGTISHWVVMHRFATYLRKLKGRDNPVGRPSGYPGNEKFKALLEKHRAGLGLIAKRLKVSAGTVHIWISRHHFKGLAGSLREGERPDHKGRGARLARRSDRAEAEQSILERHAVIVRRVQRIEDRRVEDPQYANETDLVMDALPVALDEVYTTASGRRHLIPRDVLKSNAARAHSAHFMRALWQDPLLSTAINDGTLTPKEFSVIKRYFSLSRKDLSANEKRFIAAVAAMAEDPNWDSVIHKAVGILLWDTKRIPTASEVRSYLRLWEEYDRAKERGKMSETTFHKAVNLISFQLKSISGIRHARYFGPSKKAVWYTLGRYQMKKKVLEDIRTLSEVRPAIGDPWMGRPDSEGARLAERLIMSSEDLKKARSGHIYPRGGKLLHQSHWSRVLELPGASTELVIKQPQSPVALEERIARWIFDHEVRAAQAIRSLGIERADGFYGPSNLLAGFEYYPEDRHRRGVIMPRLAGENARARFHSGPEYQSAASPAHNKRFESVLHYLETAAAMAEAVALFNSLGWVHGDLKPANFFVEGPRKGREQKIILYDFDTARTVGESTPYYEDGKKLIMGTDGFMSSEQAAGFPASFKDDVYGLSATLAWLWSGHLLYTPYEGTNMEGRRIQQKNADNFGIWPDFEKALDGNPLKEVILTGLAKPGMRPYARVSEMMNEIQAAIDREAGARLAKKGGEAGRPRSAQPSRTDRGAEEKELTRFMRALFSKGDGFRVARNDTFAWLRRYEVTTGERSYLVRYTVSVVKGAEAASTHMSIDYDEPETGDKKYLLLRKDDPRFSKVVERLKELAPVSDGGPDDWAASGARLAASADKSAPGGLAAELEEYERLMAAMEVQALTRVQETRPEDLLGYDRLLRELTDIYLRNRPELKERLDKLRVPVDSLLAVTERSGGEEFLMALASDLNQNSRTSPNDRIRAMLFMGFKATQIVMDYLGHRKSTGYERRLEYEKARQVTVAALALNPQDEKLRFDYAMHLRHLSPDDPEKLAEAEKILMGLDETRDTRVAMGYVKLELARDVYNEAREELGRGKTAQAYVLQQKAERLIAEGIRSLDLEARPFLRGISGPRGKMSMALTGLVFLNMLATDVSRLSERMPEDLRPVDYQTRVLQRQMLTLRYASAAIKIDAANPHSWSAYLKALRLARDVTASMGIEKFSPVQLEKFRRVLRQLDNEHGSKEDILSAYPAESDALVASSIENAAREVIMNIQNLLKLIDDRLRQAEQFRRTVVEAIAKYRGESPEEFRAGVDQLMVDSAPDIDKDLAAVMWDFMRPDRIDLVILSAYGATDKKTPEGIQEWAALHDADVSTAEIAKRFQNGRYAYMGYALEKPDTAIPGADTEASGAIVAAGYNASDILYFIENDGSQVAALENEMGRLEPWFEYLGYDRERVGRLRVMGEQLRKLFNDFSERGRQLLGNRKMPKNDRIAMLSSLRLTRVGHDGRGGYKELQHQWKFKLAVFQNEVESLVEQGRTKARSAMSRLSGLKKTYGLSWLDAVIENAQLLMQDFDGLLDASDDSYLSMDVYLALADRAETLEKQAHVLEEDLERIKPLIEQRNRVDRLWKKFKELFADLEASRFMRELETAYSRINEDYENAAFGDDLEGLSKKTADRLANFESELRRLSDFRRREELLIHKVAWLDNRFERVRGAMAGSDTRAEEQRVEALINRVGAMSSILDREPVYGQLDSYETRLVREETELKALLGEAEKGIRLLEERKHAFILRELERVRLFYGHIENWYRQTILPAYQGPVSQKITVSQALDKISGLMDQAFEDLRDDQAVWGLQRWNQFNENTDRLLREVVRLVELGERLQHDEFLEVSRAILHKRTGVYERMTGEEAPEFFKDPAAKADTCAITYQHGGPPKELHVYYTTVPDFFVKTAVFHQVHEKLLGGSAVIQKWRSLAGPASNPLGVKLPLSITLNAWYYYFKMHTRNVNMRVVDFNRQMPILADLAFDIAKVEFEQKRQKLFSSEFPDPLIDPSVNRPWTEEDQVDLMRGLNEMMAIAGADRPGEAVDDTTREFIAKSAREGQITGWRQEVVLFDTDDIEKRWNIDADPKSGARLAEGNAVSALLPLFELEKARTIRMKKGDGYSVRTIQVNAKDLSRQWPLKGLTILRHELADTTRFDLVHNAEGRLIAIFPRHARAGKKTFYYDLSDYYVPLDLLKRSPDAETMREWELFAEQVKKDKAAIRRYQAARRDRGLMPGTMMPDRQKPFFFAQIDPRSGEYDVVPFSHEDLTLSGSGSVLLEKFKMRPGTRRGIFVNFPSVYPPAHGANINSDREFVRTVLKGALTRPLVGGDNVLDVGTGTGFLLWVVHSAALERGVKLDYFATDINPIAVANATLNTAVAGIPLRAAKVYDNLISPKGVPVFPEERFKMILSNSPAYLPGTGMADEWEEIATVGQKAQNLKSFWDGDLSGEFTLRFAEGLFKQLHPEGVAIAWNQIVTELGLDPVAEIFKHARSDDSKWGLHVSAKRLWMAENLYFSTYVITLAKSGARFAAVGDWPGRSGEESDLDFHGRVERMIARGLTYEEAMLWWKSKVYSDITFPKGFWASPTTAIHFTLVVLDELVPGFRAARQRNDIRTMAGLYRQYVKSYEPKDRKRYATKGAQSFFYEMGRLGGLMNGQRTYLSKTGSPGALIRLALPELIDLTNPDALDPLEVESGYWNDPENAKYHILKTLDSIPGFRQARERNDIAAMAKLYRDHVIGYVSKDKTKYPRNGQLSFFFEVGGLMSLLNNRQTYLQRKGSPYAILSLALPRLVDQSDPGALRLSELGYTAEDQMMLAPVLRTYGKKETIQNAPVFDFSAMNIFFDWYEAQDTKALQDAQIPARKISAGHTAKLLSAAGKVRGSGRYFVMKAVAYDRAMRQKDVISKEIQRIWSSKPFKNYPTPEARLRAEFNNDLLLSGTFKPVRKSFRDYVLNIAFERYGRQLVPGARLAKSPGQADALDGGAWLLVASTFLKSDTAVKHRYDHVLEKYPVSHVTAALFVLASASSRRAGFQDIYSRYIHYTGLGHSVEISALLTAASVFTKDKSLGVPLHYYEELVEKVRHKFVSAILTLATAFETQQSWGVVEGLYREMLEQDTVGDPVAAAALSIAAARRGTSVEKLKTLFEVYGRGRRSSYVSALLTLAHSLSSPKSVEDLKKKHESFMDFIQFGPIGARLAETERALTQKRRDGVVRRLYEKSLRGKKVTISELVADLGMKFHTVYDDLNARGLLNSKRLDIDRRKPLSMRELNMRRDQVSKTLLHKNPAHGKKWTIPMLAKALELPREIVYRDLRAGKLLGSKRLHLREMPTEEGLEARRARVANKLKEWNIIRLADELGLDPDTVYTDLKSMNLLSRLGMRTVRRTPAAEVKSRRQRVKKRFYERPPDGRQWTVTALADDLELPLKTVFDDLKKLDLLDSKRLRRHHGKQGARLAATRVSSPSPAVREPAGSRLAVNEEWDEDAPRMEKLRRMRPGQKRKNSDAESRFIEEKRKLKARLEEARQLTKAGRFDEAEEVLRSLIKHGENLTAQAAESWRLQFLIELNYIHTAQAVNFSKQATRAFRDWNATRDPEALKHAQTLNQQTLASFENARKNLLSVMASLQEKRETNQFWSDRLTWLEGEIRFTEARIARTSSASQSGARPDTEASSGLASDGARLADGVAGSSDVELLRNRVNVHMKAEPIRKAVERLILEIVDTFSKADRSKHLALALGPYNEDPITFKIRVNDTETRLDLMIPGLDDPILMIEGDLRQKLEFLKKEEGSYIHPEGVPPPVHTLLNISKIRVDIALNSVPSGRHPVGHVIPVAAFGEDPKDAQLTLLITQLAGTHRIEARRQDRFYLEGLSAAQIRSAEKLIDKHKAHKYIFLLAPEEDKDFKGIVVRYVPTDSLKTAPVRDERTLLFPVAGFEADALLGWFEAIPTAGALADAYGAAFDPRTLQIDHTKVDPSSFHMNVYSLFLEKTLNKGLDRAALKAVLEGRADLDTFRQASFFLPLARKVPLQELIRGARLAMQALGAAA